MIARNPDKLQKLQDEIIRNTGNSEIRYLLADFIDSHRDPESFYRSFVDDLKKYEISILINNVETGTN